MTPEGDATRPATPIKVFVISPIGADQSDTRLRADQVLEYIIRKALPSPEFQVARGDESDDPGIITTDIINSIRDANLVVADLTGHNPNVFYELAVAHGYQVPTVHIMEAGTEIPFDIKAQRAVPYRLDMPGSVFEAIASLERVARRALEGQGQGPTNPIEIAGQFAAAARSDNPQESMLASIMLEVRSLGRRVEHVDVDGQARIDAMKMTDMIVSHAENFQDYMLIDWIMDFLPKDPAVRAHWVAAQRELNSFVQKDLIGDGVALVDESGPARPRNNMERQVEAATTTRDYAATKAAEQRGRRKRA